ncbi:MAG: response regulator transcription factor [Myxococcota bacterium]
MALRILLAEDHKLLREGLRALLDEGNGGALHIIEEVSNGHDAVSCTLDRGPDVVVMDVGLPGLNGIEATRQITAERPDIRVIMLTMHDDAATVDRALRAGARGYILKGCDAETLRTAIETVARGEVYLHSAISDVVLQGYLQRGEELEADPLTPREREVIQLIAEGNTSREIAQRLGLKTKTVQNYRTQIMDKLGVKTTAGLVRYALRAGIAQ